MANFNTQNYNYANNSSGELVNVSNARHGEKYFCPVCGEIMTPHMGKIRRWHFTHKNVKNCSYESYLHNLAKIKIRETFLSSEHFLLSYNAKAICSQRCPYIGSTQCETEKAVEYDLRKFYDTCELEVAYHQFRADLILYSSTNPDRPPVLIEIMVTHKCTAEKINDGVRIIEIPIHSEEDIDNIINKRKLSAIRHNQSRFVHSNRKDITLYNFNKIEKFDPADRFDKSDISNKRKDTILLWINQRGQFGYCDCHCYEVGSKILPNIHYLITQFRIPFKTVFQEFSKRGVKLRNCFLCKFSKQDFNGERLCVLYKKYGLPRKPSPDSATSCPYYKEDYEPITPLEQLNDNCIVRPGDLCPYHRGKCYYHICKATESKQTASIYEAGTK